ncbi:MAG: cob(I)yrinic acid a,c-diamide adenosyltransferase [Deltaproteobacteria bacterium]|nr:cob(I)yrinic acid a,c-diamide adenosyltransferase [Deltaproteobacteria bacterium]
MGLEKGFVQVYTGDGKGKTTAALGLALRAVGHGLRVVMIQFLKDDGRAGELAAAQHLAPLLTIKPMGRPGFIGPEGPQPGDVELANAAMQEAEKVLSEKGCDVLILDEINVAVHLGVISQKALLALVARKPSNMELVLTGRGAPEGLLQKADLVTTMQCTKHYYDVGQAARLGIEV